ncbi:MAG TPA: DoxX family protein [Vicinamibacterales bacterium]|nr:DoxX family protein [Vicinamibacterales bacterium]
MAENLTRLIEDVRGSGIYPATGPAPPGKPVVRTPAELGHPELQRRSIRIAPENLETPALLAGRAILGGYFLYNGINHFVNRQMLVEYAGSKGVPAPAVAVAASGVLIVAGGLSVIAGIWPKVGAGLISTFLLGVSPQMHAFWKEQEPQSRMQEMVNFTKNMALVGASLLAAAHPEPWPWRVPVRTASTVPASARS